MWLHPAPGRGPQSISHPPKPSKGDWASTLHGVSSAALGSALEGGLRLYKVSEEEFPRKGWRGRKKLRNTCEAHNPEVEAQKNTKLVIGLHPPPLPHHYIQFSSVAQSCPTLCDPMNRSTPGLSVHHQLLELTQTHVHRVSDVIQPSHPLSSPSPPAPSPSQHQSLFQ